MPYTNPSATDFKNYFVRDFPYGVDTTEVMDSDITSALADANFNFNPALFANQSAYTLGFLLLAAHYLVLNLRASSQGISGQYSWLQTSKGVGSVNEGITIPQRILDNPEFAMLSKTNYGAKFLSFILPQLCGNIFSVQGGTRP